MLQWNFTKLSTMKYETNEYTIDEGYQNISIVTNTADITFAPSDTADSKVVCYEQSKVRHTVSIKDGALAIEMDDTRKWYDHIGFSFSTPTITVYLPKGAYGALTVKNKTGHMNVPADFQFESMNVTTSTGHVTTAASVAGAAKIKTSTGDICVENASVGALNLAVTTGEVTVSSVACEGNAVITVSTGKTKLSDVQCQNLSTSGNTGRIHLENVIVAKNCSIERSTGDITFTKCDAAELLVVTDTGDVTGSLLSDKVFLVQTDTGRIDVPQTISGGRCSISTDTGDIRITVE